MLRSDVVCLSHLRWGFVFQRPNHLMTRAARERRVFYVEESVEADGVPGLDISRPVAELPGLHVVVPRVARGLTPDQRLVQERALLDSLLLEHSVARPILWFYTPMALEMSRHVDASLVVYDCMDELSQFASAPPELRRLEAELFARADVVFTGGQSLYEAKRSQHRNVHAFPSSVDVAHFARARGRRSPADPADQAHIPPNRVGFFGVIDERFDTVLVGELARLRPDLQLVMIGPVVKIDPASLPQAPNLHWLGQKTYAELPAYIGGWSAAIMPFARNQATEFISPTKTLEFMAAGTPVVSTAIRDVVRPYGNLKLVRIADDAAAFSAALDAALAESPAARLAAFDVFLAGTSWDRTWSGMRKLLLASAEPRQDEQPRGRPPAVHVGAPVAHGAQSSGASGVAARTAANDTASRTGSLP